MKNEMNAWLRNGRKNNAFVERLSEISPNEEIDFKFLTLMILEWYFII